LPYLALCALKTLALTAFAAKPCKNLRHVAASVILVAATFLQKSPLALNAAAPSAKKVSLDSPARL
jgi:hypothetical protein